MAFKHKELQNGITVFSIGLRKEWSKVSSYWVSLVAVPLGKLYFWYPARSWSFNKKGEHIEDELPGSRQSRGIQAFRLMKDMVQDKIQNSDYVINEIKVDDTVDPALLTSDLTSEISSYCSVLRQVTSDPAVQRAGQTPQVADWIKEKEREAQAKTEAHNLFQSMVKQRKKDAKWG